MEGPKEKIAKSEELDWDQAPPRENMAFWTPEDVEAYSQIDESFVERGVLQKFDWIQHVTLEIFMFLITVGFVALVIYEWVFEGLRPF